MLVALSLAVMAGCGPDDGTADYEKGEVAYASRDLQAAVLCFSAAAAKNPTNFKARVKLALANMDLGEIAAAKAAVGSAIAIDPASAEARLLDGNIAYLAKDYAGAKSAFADVSAARQLPGEIRSKAMVSQAVLASSSLFSATNNPVFVCAWDRNGVSANSNISESPFRNISSYGSAITRPMTVGANFGMQRYLFASTMAEKTQYIPTRLISSIADASDNGTTMASTYPFKPALLMAIYSANSTTTNSIFSFNVEWQFDVTFRGTRNFPESTA